jgi:hypothetical protein
MYVPKVGGGAGGGPGGFGGFFAAAGIAKMDATPTAARRRTDAKDTLCCFMSSLPSLVAL